MKWKLLSVFTVLLFTLMACQGADNAADQGTNNNPNVDPTAHGNNGNGFFNNDQDYNDQDYTLERNADRNQGGINSDGRMNNNGMNNNQDGESRYEIANEAADQIAEEIDEIDNAYVLTMERNAYVAANLDVERENRTENRNQNNPNDEEQEVSEEVEKQIGEIVRSVDEDIENVYVSTNPDFLDLVTNYADEADQGRPIGGFFDQIGTMIDRIFPDNRGQ